MKRLRHPIRAIREPFGTAGLVVACVALIAALGGTALAAGKLTGKQKKEVEKIAKKFAGKPGANGAQGPAGPQGTAGANGKDGAAGQNGTNGTNGTNGASVSVQELGLGDENCAAGGSEFKVGSGTPTYACNGEEGSPWPAGGVLPSGQTERGTWGGNGSNRSVYSLNEETGELEQEQSNTIQIIPISFALPVKPAPEVLFSKQLEQEWSGETVEPVEGCPGLDEEGLPMADPGKLCVYQRRTSAEGNPIFFGGTQAFPEEQGADSMGTEVAFPCGGANCFWTGVWAVTAE